MAEYNDEYAKQNPAGQESGGAQDASAEQSGDGGTPELSLSEEELGALCREHVCPSCEVMKEAEDRYLRSMADTENLRKRLTREAEEMRKYVGEAILADLLPVVDNLDLALDHAASVEGCGTIVTGVDMTRKMFLEILERHGLTPLGEKGETFNPEFHEAVGTVPDEGMGASRIGQLVQRGFMLKGRLLRPAKVMVTTS